VVSFVVNCSFFLRSYLGLDVYQHFLLILLLPPILLSYYFFVFLTLFLCTGLECVLVCVLRCKTGSLGPGFLQLCYGVWPYFNQFSIWLPPLPSRLFSSSVSICQPMSFFLFFITFSPSSYLLCRLPAISVLIHPLKSAGGYF
jgi:hypothetical protein